jgi:tubulin beta
MACKDVDEQFLNIQTRNTSYFVEWIPNTVKSSICDIPPCGLKMAAIFIGNTTVFRELFTRVDSQFSKMYARRAFIHWYVNECLETVEFDEVDSNMTDLIQFSKRRATLPPCRQAQNLTVYSLAGVICSWVKGLFASCLDTQ